MNITPLITLPITDPVLKFLIILAIILAAPLLLNRIRIPHLIGLIIAGAVVGPSGFNLISRDSSIILSGTAGLLYIMFLAGLEIDMGEFKKNSFKSAVFGLYTFLVPMGLGYLASKFLFGFSELSSILLASMLASHTLIAYPIISKLGVTKDPSVTVTVGGTVITDTLALLVLTVIVGMTNGEVDNAFWIKLGVSVLLFGVFVMLLYPVISRWFFKHVDDNVSQYIFVLALLFFSSWLASVAGLEPIIGAFLAGMAMNRLIPSTSPLMNRVEFVGNAIFIPFFLIGVGMLIDYRAFFTDWETIKVGVILILAAVTAKWCAAWLTQKTFRFSTDQRNVIFGLSNAQAAATLAAVTVGYNVILGTTDDGQPIRLLNDAVLNGTILMILVTCTMASFSAQRGASNIALSDVHSGKKSADNGEERILISLNREDTVRELVQLSTALTGGNKDAELYALNVVDSSEGDDRSVKIARKILNEAVVTGAATDNYIQDLLRYDTSRTNAVVGVMKERAITDLIVDLTADFNTRRSLFSRYENTLIAQNHITTFVYRPVQPLSTVRRHLIVIPDKAEREVGFSLWIRKIWRLAANTGAKMVFYASEDTRQIVASLTKQHRISHEFVPFDDWNDFLILSKEIKSDDCLWTVMSRREHPSYNPAMYKVPSTLQKYFTENSFVLLYPVQSDHGEENRYYT